MDSKMKVHANLLEICCHLVHVILFVRLVTMLFLFLLMQLFPFWEIKAYSRCIYPP